MCQLAALSCRMVIGTLAYWHIGILATGAGVDMVIANGANANVLYDIVDGKDVGTRFVGKNNK